MYVFHFMFYFFTLHLKSYYSFLKYSTMESFRGFLFFSNAFDQSLKDPQRKRPEFWENSLMERLECVYSLNSKKYVVICLLENKIFSFLKQNNPTYFAKIVETCSFNYAFLLSHTVQAVVRKRFLKKFRKFHRKTPVSESLFHKKGSKTGVFLWNFRQF